MKTYLISLFMATSVAFAQVDEWQRLIQHGMVLEDSGDYAGAATAYRGAVRIAERSDPHDPRLPFAINSLAMTLEDLGDFSQAEHQFRRALLIVERDRGKNNPEYAVILTSLASLLRWNGTPMVKREGMLRESTAIFAKVLPPNAPRAAVAQVALAELLISKRKYPEAEALLNESLAVFEQQPQPVWKNVSITLSNLGLVKMFQGRNEEAERLLEKSVRIIERELGPHHPTLVPVLNNLAIAYFKSGRRSDADTVFQRALIIAEKHLSMGNPIHGKVILSYADFLRQTGQKWKAKQLQARAEEMLRENVHRNSMTVDASTLLRK